MSAYFGLRHIAVADVIYITPGQTFFGLVKYAPFMWAARLFGRPYVIHVHGNHLGSHYGQLAGVRRWLFRNCVSRAAAGIVLSESLRANFIGLLPADAVFVVENFAGDELFEQSLREKASDRLEVLYLSNLMREKGILELLSSLAILKERNVQFRARIAGHLESGIATEVLEQLPKLAPEVEYVGPVSGSRKVALLREANVFVLPTYYTMEGQPISLLEGMASGNIIVTTAHAGIPDIVNESNGYFVPIRDADALAMRLSLIEENLSAEVRRFSAYNQQAAAERFTEHAFVERVMAVLQRAVTPGAEGAGG